MGSQVVSNKREKGMLLRGLGEKFTWLYTVTASLASKASTKGLQRFRKKTKVAVVLSYYIRIGEEIEYTEESCDRW